MTFTCISEAEVLEKYHKAEDKEYIIEVLAGLTASTQVEMREFLGLGMKHKKKIAPPAQLDTEEAKRLYDLGLCDREMAERLGVQKTIVRNWRQRKGILCNPEKLKRVPEQLQEERMRLYKMGLTDGEIGKLVGLTKAGIQSWRRANNLPVNIREGGVR